MRRFVLLEHIGHPDDPVGRHYDLLLEEGDACRTWRLAEIPVAGGPPVAAAPLPPHRLAWLDTPEAEVSGGRGFARRIDAGSYEEQERPGPDAVAAVSLRLLGTVICGRLTIVLEGRGWAAQVFGPAGGT